MPRALLAEEHIHPAVRAQVASHQRAVVDEVQAAVATHAVVFVRGTLVGGANDLQRLLASGELHRLLAPPPN